MSEGPDCQSCGMPLSRDAMGGGTEADGRKTTEYCSHCYRNGAFTDPDLTADQMMARVRGRLEELKIPPKVVDHLTGQIPTLRRWAR